MKRVIVFIMILVIAFLLIACSETHSLVDTRWKTDVSVLGIAASDGENYAVLEFNEDGIGSLSMVSLDVIDLNYFKYYVNGDALTVTADSGEIVECIYETNGDALIIKTQYRTTVYTRIYD